MVIDSFKTDAIRELFLSKAVELASDAIIAINEDFKIIYINQETERSFGYDKEEVVGKHIEIFIPHEYRKNHNSHIQGFIENDITARLMSERGSVDVKGLRKNGELFPAEISIIKVKHSDTMVLVAIVRDITLRKNLEKQLKNYAEIDSLTGLYNRRLIEELAENEILRSKRYGRSLAILLVDIDHFKRVNDQYGHTVGDEVIKHVIDLCQGTLRKSDIMGRWGGEEFVILLPELDAKNALIVAEKLRNQVSREPYEMDDGNKLSIQVSIGGYNLNENIGNWKDSFKVADKALYKAKENGRNQSVFLDQ